MISALLLLLRLKRKKHKPFQPSFYANANANADDNNRSSFQPSNQWIRHHMEEATRMTRDLEQCLGELNRIQVQNAIVMDHLVMAGADLHA